MATGRDHKFGDHRLQGETILERLKDLTVPAALKPFVAALKAEQSKLEQASKSVDTTRTARDKALDEIAIADFKLDNLVLELATDLVGARLGDRKNPFRDFSPYVPSKIIELAYQTEAKEVTKLLQKLSKAKLDAKVKAAAASCKKGVSAVEAKLKSLTRPQAAYTKALATRDALLPEWTKAFHRFKVNALAAWVDSPEVTAALFAPPDKHQDPGRGRKRGEAPPPPPPSAPPAPPAP